MATESAVATRHGGEIRPPSWLAQTAILLEKDLRIELRTGEVLVTSGFFGVLVVVLGSLAFYVGPDTRGQVAAGVIWLAVSFASVLALGRLWQREREDGAFEGVIDTGIAPSALFAGKALGLLAFLGLIELVVEPLTFLLFSLEPADFALPLLAITLFATPGIAAAGTLFGAMTVRTRARDLVLAVVLLALLAPDVLTAVAATRELFGGARLAELGDYFRLLGVFDVTFVAGGLGLLGLLLGDT
ncbi:MAG TPA: heme exporter protein CcmB [Polyangiaceae bacterium]|nr:heme exporter protein CcmB [Polyangiaceae bacterium]